MDRQPESAGFRSRNGLHDSAPPDMAIDDVPDRQELRRTIDFRLTFPYYGSVRQWLPYSIWIQPLPERGSHQCGPYSSAFVLSGTGYPSPRFVHPGCTATTNRIQVGEMLEDQLKRTDMRQRDATERHRLRRDAEARRFSLPSTQAADKLIRYETHIDRKLYHAMDELERLRS